MQGFDLSAFAALAQQTPQGFQQPVQHAPTHQQNFGQLQPPQGLQFPGGFQLQPAPQPQGQLQMPAAVNPLQAFVNTGVGQQNQQMFGGQAVPAAGLATVQAPAPAQQPGAQANAIFYADEWHAQFGWLSNWFPAPFQGTKGNCKYITVEQYLCEKIARCAGDEEARKAIMAVTWAVTNAQGQIDWNLNRQANQYLRQLATQVRNFSLEAWEPIKTQVMRTALLYKFCQNQQLHDLLLATGDDVLFEATTDRIWGIGCTEEQARSGQIPIAEWGSNLTGFLLMEIRSTLRKVGKPTWALTAAQKPEVSLTRSEVPATAPVASTTETVVPPGNAISVLLNEAPAAQPPKDKGELEPVKEVAAENLVMPVQPPVIAAAPAETPVIAVADAPKVEIPVVETPKVETPKPVVVEAPKSNPLADTLAAVTPKAMEPVAPVPIGTPVDAVQVPTGGINPLLTML